MSALASARSASSPAHAAVAITSFKSVPISGKTVSGKAFKGTFTVDRFVSRNGKTYALGTLAGKVGQRMVSRRNVAIPVKVASATTGGARDAAVCPILHLVLGPLNLNLLGLHVHLNTVVLDITATSGPGNLLGNLLCSVSNLLNGGLPAPLTLSQLTGLLNIVQQLVNNPGLLNL
jgi:hypothetical protein